MKYIKTVTALLLTLLMIFSLASCKGAAQNETDDSQIEAQSAEEEEPQRELKELTFVLDWTPNTNHTGLYVAMEKGWLAEAGITVKVVQPPEDGAEVLVGSGKAEFGVSFQDYLAPLNEGEGSMPVTAVAAILQHNDSGIVSRAGEGIERPKGLEGKKYATWDLDIEKATLKRVVEADGGDFSKVELIPSTVTDEVSALKSGSVDAIWIFYGWAGIATEVAGLETDFFAFADIDKVFDYYTPVIIANDSFLQSDPETAKAFLSALKKGYEFAAENPEEAAKILIDAAPELKDSEEFVVASQKYLADKYIDDAESWGVFDAARWNAFYGWLNENGLVAEDIPENSGFTNDFLEG